MKLAVDVAGQTDVGCVRANNEDNFGYDSRYGIFVLCDGMGGQAAGEVASKMAVDTLLEYFRAEVRPEMPPERAQSLEVGIDKDVTAAIEPGTSKLPALVSAGSGSLADAIHLANTRIYNAGQTENGRSGMGSTIVAALLRGNSLAIANVGDSRIYLIRQGSIEQLTEDHSLVMEQVRLGYITREQAETSDLQNVILRALGSEAEVQPDVEDLVAVSGDLILLTSDGLTRYVRDQEILGIVTTSASLQGACAQLITTAKDRGGDDNVSCLLIRTVERPWYKKIFHAFSGGQEWQNSI
ncbi:MAG TPA: Stp1/IreP family PP2C-type Ser/Thr phosphatase [Terriglobales bacterium]